MQGFFKIQQFNFSTFQPGQSSQNPILTPYIHPPFENQLKMKIDINCDMGESYGRFQIGNDAEIMPYIDSCNIACGMHGGDPMTILKTISLAVEMNKKIGAHPSYPDLEGFGRRSMTIPMDELKAIIIFQIASLYTLVEKAGSKLNHVKVHGALYNDAAEDEKLADCVLDAVGYIDTGLGIYTFPDSAMSRKGNELGLNIIHEAFADRRYTDDLRLQSRTIPGAVIDDPRLAAQQVKDIVSDNKVTTVNGIVAPLHAQTICIHGDSPSALGIAKAVHHIMERPQ